MQDLYGLEKDVHGINVSVLDKSKTRKTANELQETLGRPYHTLTWLDLKKDFLNVLAMEKALLFSISGLIIVISIFLIMATMLINVMRKTREIGLLGAMGATPSKVAAMFCYQGVFICTAGISLGLSVSYILILPYVTELLSLLFLIFGVDQAIIEYYMFRKVPVDYSLEELTCIVIGTYFFTFLATLIPAWRATQLRPADALRSE